MLATVDASTQPSSAGGALVFTDNPLVSGYPLPILRVLPTCRSPNPASTKLPSRNCRPRNRNHDSSHRAGAALPGRRARHRRLCKAHPSPHPPSWQPYPSVSLSKWDSSSSVTVVVDQAGFNFQELGLTVQRLGDA